MRAARPDFEIDFEIDFASAFITICSK